MLIPARFIENFIFKLRGSGLYVLAPVINSISSLLPFNPHSLIQERQINSLKREGFGLGSSSLVEEGRTSKLAEMKFNEIKWNEVEAR